MEVSPLWMLVPLIILALLGCPIGFSLAGIGLCFGFFFWGPQFLSVIVTRFAGFQTNYILVAIPLFIFMGALLEQSGVGDKLYEAMHLMMGGVRGGLASATIVISSLFAACTGVVSASVTTVGFLTLPGMVKRHYNKDLASGAVMAGGCLGMLIPPSIMLVVIGAWSELSVGKLFLAAFLPGLLVSLLYIIYISIRCGVNPNLGPPLPIEERRASVGHKIQLLFVGLLPPLFLILAVLGTIIFGIATTTEAAGMGALGSIIIVALNRHLSLSTFLEACYRTVRLCGMIAVIACGALTFASAFLGLGGGELVEEMLLGLGVGSLGVLAIMLLCLLVMGAFMDWFEILVITIPIFFPIAKMLGFDLIWFSILIAVVLQTSFLTPPYGLALFFLKGITPLIAPEITMANLMRGIIPFTLLLILALIILVFFPEIALWLPAKIIT